MRLGLAIWLFAACSEAPPAVQPPPIAAPKVVRHGQAWVPNTSALVADIAWLADPAREGRRAGSRGEADTDAWLAARFAKLGLVAAGDAGTWLQRVPLGDQHTANVLGWLPGRDANAPWVLVGAHVDHLGVDDRGQLYPGADDNASGVAAMLGVATALAASEPLRGGVLFVGFGGEEVGLVGSKWLAGHLPQPAERCAAVINLDMVGRSPFLGAREYAMPKALAGIENGAAVGVLDGESGSPLLAVAREACGEVGIRMYAAEDFPHLEASFREQAAGRSDDSSFTALHLPTLFFSTSLQDDYHQPTDTIDKIDGATLRQITQAVRVVVRRLAR